jgi:hypothetical protein
MMTRRIPVLALLVLSVSCSRGTSSAVDGPPPGGSSAASPKVGLGNVMVEVARRFEIAGRAANANRFELAEFETGEIEELFGSDVPNAEMPKEGPTAHIPTMAKALLETAAPELKKAAAARDHVAFAAAFQHMASMCNACHQASAKAFIQVPTEPGQMVPVLDPLPASSAGAR